MTEQMIPRRVVTIAALLLVLGLSHFMAYNLGRNATRKEVLEVKSGRIQRIVDTWLRPTQSADGQWVRSDKVQQSLFLVVALESIHNLKTSVWAMRAAVKAPKAFEASDLRYFRFAAKASLAELDRQIIPTIKADEAEQRERNPDRTKKDEDERIDAIREIAREAQELEAQLAKLLDKP